MKALVIVAVLCGVASAHPLDTAYLRVDATATPISITFDVDVTLAAQQLRIEPAAIDAALSSRAGELATSLYRTAAPVANGTPCTWGTVAASRKGTTVTLVDTASCLEGDAQWDLSFGIRLADTFQILGRATDRAGERVITIDKTSTTLAFAAGGHSGSFGSSVKEGIEHVGLLPSGWRGLPTGFASLMLALLLLFAGGGFMMQMSRAWLVVVGHAIAISFTLGLPPIAGSVMMLAALVALVGSMVTGKLERQRWVFGLLAGIGHGLATVTGHPIGFAVGFAIAQLGIVLVLGLLVAPLVARDELARRIVPIAAIVLGGLAIYGVVRGL